MKSLISFFLGLLLLSVNLTNLSSQDICDEVEFDLITDCDATTGSINIVIIADSILENVDYTYVTLLDSIITNETFYGFSYNEIGGYDGEVKIYIDGSLCRVIELTIMCAVVGFGLECNDFSVELLPVNCSPDSSTYNAQLVVSDFNSDIDSIKYNLINNFWYGYSNDPILNEGDTILVEGIAVGNPVFMNFTYKKDDEIINCAFSEYPETACYNSLCEVIEITNFSLTDTGFYGVINPNIFLTDALVSISINDSLLYSDIYHTYFNLFHNFSDYTPPLSEFLILEYLSEDITNLEITIELEDCTYVYNETFYANQEDIECEDFAADISIECVNEDEYKVILTVTGYNLNEGYLVNGELHYSGTIEEGPFVVGTGYNYVLSPANDTTCVTNFSDTIFSWGLSIVELLSFNGSPLREGNYIYWSAVSTNDNYYFTLQSSFDGVNFYDITTVDALQNNESTENYNYMHVTNSTMKQYYRLRATNVNGKTEMVSDIITIIRFNNDALDIRIRDDEIYVNPSSVIEEQFDISIFDMNGKIVVSNSATTSVSIANLLPKIYFVKVFDGENYKVTKFIKQ